VLVINNTFEFAGNTPATGSFKKPQPILMVMELVLLLILSFQLN
jgi:hypothetical protein